MKFRDLINEQEELKGSAFEFAVMKGKDAGISTMDELEDFLKKEFSRYYVTSDLEMEYLLKKILEDDDLGLDVLAFPVDNSEPDEVEIDFGKHGTLTIPIEDLRDLSDTIEMETTKGKMISISPDDAEDLLFTHAENWE